MKKLRIIVCVKHVPNSLKFDCLTQSIKRSGIDSDINPYDLYAVETALRLKDKYGGEVYALCMGINDAKKTLIKTISLGVDEAFLLCDKKFAGSDTFATSYILHKAINKIGHYNLIICGKQSSDGDTAQVGVELAEKLNIPFVTNVFNVGFENSKVYCDYFSDEDKIKVCCNMPCLITVENRCCEPRIPSVKNLMRSVNYTVNEWDLNYINADTKHCGLSGSYTTVKKTYNLNRIRKQCIELSGDINNQVDITKMIIHTILGDDYE